MRPHTLAVGFVLADSLSKPYYSHDLPRWSGLERGSVGPSTIPPRCPPLHHHHRRYLSSVSWTIHTFFKKVYYPLAQYMEWSEEQRYENLLRGSLIVFLLCLVYLGCLCCGFVQTCAKWLFRLVTLAMLLVSGMLLLTLSTGRIP